MPPRTAAPDTLPANFTGWDQAPDTLPANFSGFDDVKPNDAQQFPSISAKPTGVRQWLTDLESDLRYGGGQTVFGRAFQKMRGGGVGGFSRLGPEGGDPGAVIGSVPTGLTFAAHGVAEAAHGNIKRGAGEFLSGIGEAAEIPSAFIAPEAGEVAAATPGAAKAAVWFLPSNRAARAGKLFASVAEDAGSVPVELKNSSESASRLLDWQGKINPGSVVNKYLQRITSPKKGPMTYSEARDWYSVLGNLSAEESSKLPDVVQRDLKTMVRGLKQDIGDSADQVGRAADYYKAMGEYAKAKSLGDWYEKYGPIIKKSLAGGAAASVGASGAYRLYDLMSK